MKNLIILFIFVFVYSAVDAQKVKESKVPAKVKTTFSRLYPNIKKVKWEKEKGNYEAEFILRDLETTLIIDTAGYIVSTETEMQVSSLAPEIKSYVSRTYPDAKIKEATKIVDSNGVIRYEIKVKKKHLIFNSEGRPIN